MQNAPLTTEQELQLDIMRRTIDALDRESLKKLCLDSWRLMHGRQNVMSQLLKADVIGMPLDNALQVSYCRAYAEYLIENCIPAGTEFESYTDWLENNRII